MLGIAALGQLALGQFPSQPAPPGPPVLPPAGGGRRRKKLSVRPIWDIVREEQSPAAPVYVKLHVKPDVLLDFKRTDDHGDWYGRELDLPRINLDFLAKLATPQRVPTPSKVAALTKIVAANPDEPTEEEWVLILALMY